MNQRIIEHIHFPLIWNLANTSDLFFIIVGLEHWQHKQAFSISASFLSNKRLPMLLPKLFTTHHTDLLPCFKMFSNFYSFTISCTYVVVKCLCPAARHAGNELQTTLSPSPLLGYFIGPLNSCDSSSRDRVWLVFTTSSANFDTWFHWGRWDLKGEGHGSPSPLLHVV